MKVQSPKRKGVTITFSLAEMAMLHRIVCSGLLGGDAATQSSLFTKIERAQAWARLGRAVLITIEGDRYPGKDDGDGKEAKHG